MTNALPVVIELQECALSFSALSVTGPDHNIAGATAWQFELDGGGRLVISANWRTQSHKNIAIAAKALQEQS